MIFKNFTGFFLIKVHDAPNGTPPPPPPPQGWVCSLVFHDVQRLNLN